MDRSVFPRLWGFMKPYRSQATLAALSGLATVLSSIGLMSTAVWLIASAALRPSIADLQVYIVAVRFFGLSRGVFRYLERLQTHTVTLNILARLRSWTYTRLEALAPAGFIHHRSGEMLSLVMDHIETLENFYARVVSPTLIALLTSAIATLILWRVHPVLGQIMIAGVLGSGVLLPFLARQMSRPIEKRAVEKHTGLRASLIDTLQGSSELLINNREKEQLNLLSKREIDFSRVQLRSALVRGTSNALGIILSNGTMMAVLAFGIGLVATGRIPEVYLGALALGTLASFEAILPLSAAYQALEGSLASARRLFAIVDQPPQVIDPLLPSPIPEVSSSDRAIEFLAIHGLKFAYPGEPNLILERLDITIHQGDRVALVASSGCGKTTLVNLLLRFWDYSEGEIHLLGHDLRSYSPEAIRQWVGVLSQPPTLFYTSVLENILLGNPKATHERIEWAAKTAEIHDFICTLPEGYETLVGERGLSLSAGQRQRLVLARLLVRNTPFLILDEPTANLDLHLARRIMDNLAASVFPGRTILVITHDLPILKEMDTIHVLRHGKIAERGTHTELMELRGIYWKMNR